MRVIDKRKLRRRVILTQRLELRPFRADDLEALLGEVGRGAARSAGEVGARRRYTGTVSPATSILSPLRGLRVDLSSGSATPEEQPAEVVAAVPRRARAGRLPRAARAALRSRAARAREPADLRAGPADGHRRPRLRPLQRHLAARRSRAPSSTATPAGASASPCAGSASTTCRDRRLRGAVVPLSSSARRARRRAASGAGPVRGRAPGRRALGPGRAGLAGPAARAAPGLRGRRDRPGRRARRPVRLDRQQPRPLRSAAAASAPSWAPSGSRRSSSPATASAGRRWPIPSAWRSSPTRRRSSSRPTRSRRRRCPSSARRCWSTC